MKKQTKWEVVGYISVDAGCIKVGDPCYGEVENWIDFAQDSDAAQIPHEGDLEVPGAARGFGKAVLLQSGLGDGVYAVEVKRDPGYGIKEMRIKFF